MQFTAIFKTLYTHLAKPFSPKGKFVYVALGDSTVYGTGATHPSFTFAYLIYEYIKQKHKYAKFHNFGKEGARVQDVLREQLDKAIVLQPDLIVISIGANDIRKRTKLAKFQQDFSYLLKRLKKETKAEIVVNNIPDIAQAPSLSKLLRILVKFWLWKFNKVIKEQTAGKARILHIDLYSQTKLFTKKFPGIIATDGLHPSDTGYALWANTIITVLQDTLFPVLKPIK